MKKIHYILIVFTTWIFCTHAHESELSIENKQRVEALQNKMRIELTQGNIENIKNELTQAAGNFHAVEIELAIIQTLMQAGEYRNALSAAAHTQAEHPDLDESVLFYAYLLALGGQTSPATQILESALQVQPKNKPLNQLLTQIKQHQLDSQQLSIDLHDQDIQLYPFSENIHTTLNHVSNAVLISDDGTQAVTTLDTLKINDTKTNQLKQSIWLRNGLGKQTEAEVQHVYPKINLAILKLKQPLSQNKASAIIAQSIAPAGAPYYLSSYRITTPQQADWPTIKIDILGMPNTNSAYQTHLPHLVAGSPAYNTSGELVGVISQDENTSKMVVMPLGILFHDIQISKPKNTAIKQTNQTPQNPLLNKKRLDELYEETMSTSLQVLISN